jgi:prolyl-tRNA editing enzyme YbaK/EbsC (Cys-tRNA(Pro) deacylase)
MGSLTPVPILERPDLLADPVLAAVHALPELGTRGWVTEIDPAVSDTSALVAAHGVPASGSANCVVVAGRREGTERIAACLVLATTRADVNGAVRRLLDVRKASFLDMDRAVGETGMAYGAITPVGLPTGWRLLVDRRVVEQPLVLIGSGVLPGAEVIDDLALAVNAAG